jgi:hypothetical protein
MEFETKKQRSNYFRSVNTIINDGPAAQPERAKVICGFDLNARAYSSLVFGDLVRFFGFPPTLL